MLTFFGGMISYCLYELFLYFRSVFSLSPNNFNLKPKEEITVTLTGYRNNAEIVTEDFYFHAIIENMDKRQIILETVIKAEFVLPLLKFSQKNMYFRVDNGVDQTISFVTGKELLYYSILKTLSNPLTKVVLKFN